LTGGGRWPRINIRRQARPPGGDQGYASRTVERLGELPDSDDERIRLDAAKAILDRRLGHRQSRPISRRGTLLRPINWCLRLPECA
jgi:hypothetical protein